MRIDDVCLFFVVKKFRVSILIRICIGGMWLVISRVDEKKKGDVFLLVVIDSFQE